MTEETGSLATMPKRDILFHVKDYKVSEMSSAKFISAASAIFS